MTQPALNTLPRFLLPKLSWQAAPASRQCAMRAMSTYQAQKSREQRNYYASSSTRSMQYASQNKPSNSSPIIQQLQQQHRAFSASPVCSRDHHFDTLKFVKRLREEGFTEEQAVAMMRVLSDVIEERYVCELSIRTLPTLPFIPLHQLGAHG